MCSASESRRERDAVFELAGLARLPAEDSLALLLLDLAGDDQLGVAHLDVDVLAIDAGKLSFDDPGIVGLLDVGDRHPRAAVAASGR